MTELSGKLTIKHRRNRCKHTVIISLDISFQARNITTFSTTKYSNESSLYSMTFDLNYQTDECGNITTSCVIGKKAISSLCAANEVKHCERE